MIAEAGKFCPRCGEEKPICSFHQDRRSGDGLQVYFKACKVRQVSERRERLSSDSGRELPESKPCVTCRRSLPPSAFYPSKGEIDGLSYRCRQCVSVVQAAAKYGITVQEVEALREREQCDICGRCLTRKTSNIDHCHSTGKVRGALCGNCNTMLGMASDMPEVLEKGAEYLRSFIALAKTAVEP